MEADTIVFAPAIQTLKYKEDYSVVEGHRASKWCFGIQIPVYVTPEHAFNCHSILEYV